MGIYRLSLSQIICEDLHLKCFKRRHAQELTDANCAACMKHAKLLLQKFPQYTTDFVFFTDKKVFSVTSPDNWQNKDSGRLWELLKKKLSVFFSVGIARSATAWPAVNCACVQQLLEQLINTMLCPAFLRKFACQPIRCVPLQMQTFLSKSCSRRLMSRWLLTNTAVKSVVINFRCHKLIAKLISKRTVIWKILFAISMEKYLLFWSPKISKFVDE